MIVAYPFLSAAAAIVLGDWWKKPNGMMLVACLIVGLSLFHYLIELPFGITLTRFRLFLGIVFVPYLIASMLRYEALIVRIQKGMMAVLVLSTTILTYFYTHPA